MIQDNNAPNTPALTPAPTSPIKILDGFNSQLEKIQDQLQESRKKRDQEKTPESAQAYALLMELARELVNKITDTIGKLDENASKDPNNLLIIDKSKDLISKMEYTNVAPKVKTDDMVPRGALDTDVQKTKNADRSTTRTHTIKCNPEDKDIAQQAIDNVMQRHGMSKGADGNYPVDGGHSYFSGSISHNKANNIMNEINTEFRKLYTIKHGAENISKQQKSEEHAPVSNAAKPSTTATLQPKHH